jgi:hypothetical protein
VLIDPSGEAATTTLVDTFEIAPDAWLGDSLVTVAGR